MPGRGVEKGNHGRDSEGEVNTSEEKESGVWFIPVGVSTTDREG